MKTLAAILTVGQFLKNAYDCARSHFNDARSHPLAQMKSWQSNCVGGWIYGAENFVARLIDRFEKPFTEHHRSEERIQTDEELAERIARAQMKELGWDEKELRRRRKGDQNKLRIATTLRCSTSVNLKWIARRLQMAGVTFQIYSELKQKVQKVRTDPNSLIRHSG